MVRATIKSTSKKIQSDSKKNELESLIADAIFESPIGIIVTDNQKNILKVNKTFTDITGYASDEVVGKTPQLLNSGIHDNAYYSAMWTNINEFGFWQGEIWNRHKNGEVYPDCLTIKSVTNSNGQVTNYVATFIDSSKRKLQEQRRIAEETAQRDTLVREVHHRIKNNLQGVTGVLRNFAAQHPEVSVPVSEAISQVQSIAIIHGLQGRTSLTKVRLCELTKEIAALNQALWNTPILIDIPAKWIPSLIAESEAVPIALILNELITNAIKHGDKRKGIKIIIRHSYNPYIVTVTIVNHGKLPLNFNISQPPSTGIGLQLVSSLLPKKGVNLNFENIDNNVISRLEFGSTAISFEDKD